MNAKEFFDKVVEMRKLQFVANNRKGLLLR